MDLHGYDHIMIITRLAHAWLANQASAKINAIYYYILHRVHEDVYHASQARELMDVANSNVMELQNTVLYIKRAAKHFGIHIQQHTY